MARTTKKNGLLNKVQDIFKQADENGIIISETIMLACGLSEEEVESISRKGLKEVPNIIQQKIDKGELTDEQFLKKLFSLELHDLEQLPISFYAEVVKSKALKTFGKDEQEYIFSAIFKTLGIDDVKDIANMEAEKVAYNHQYYKDIVKAYVEINPEFAQQRKDDEAFYLIDNKLQEMLDKAPVLTNNPKQLKNFAPYKGVNGHNGNLEENTEAVLALFEDSKEITKDKINALGLDKNSQYFSNTAARAGLAQYKLGAYAEAAKAKGLIKKNQSTENFSVVDPNEKNSPVNKYVNTIKNVVANFAKPQNLAKTGFRTIATQAIQHFTEGAIPGVGAAVGLVIKLGECAKKIHHDKQKPSEVFKAALPDLARGVVTLGASFTPVAPVAGLIGSVASVAVKGIQAAHEEGLTFGHGFMKRIGKEFTKKGNLFNLAMSAAGTAVGIGARKAGGLGALWDKIRGHDGNEQAVAGDDLTTANVENQTLTDTETNDLGVVADLGEQSDIEYGPQMESDFTENSLNSRSILDYDQDGNLIDRTSDQGNEDVFKLDENGNIVVQGGNTAEIETEQTLSYAEQYIQDHPGAHFDKNGWVQNADGSYAKNENGQLFGNEERVFRNLRENETLDKAGNIVEKSETEPKWVFGEPANKSEEISVEEAYFQELAKKADDLKNLAKASGKTTDEILNEMEKVVEENPTFAPEYEQMKQAGAALKEEIGSTKLPPESVNFHPEGATVKQPEPQVQQGAAIVEEQTSTIEPQYEQSTPASHPIPKFEQAQSEPQVQQETVDETSVEPETTAQQEQPTSEPQSEAVTQRSATAAREPEPEIVRTPLTVRSPEELAQIDALQAKANQAHDFNSLPEHWQKELIEIKAKGIVAQENGDTAAYENYKKEFDTKFCDYVAKDRELDRISKSANIKGTQEYYQRQNMEDAIAGRSAWGIGDDWTQEERQEKIKEFIEKYGDDMGTGKDGVRRYVRHSGGFKEEVPDVPAKNFAELGYQQQEDGTWILKNRFTTKVVTDVNHNGIPDAGDTYEQVTEIGKPGSGFYSKERSSGQYVAPVREQINPSRNAQTELENALARERARLSEQAQEQTASVLIPGFESGSEK